MIKEIICNINNHKLCRENEFYFIVFPDNTTMVNTSGSNKILLTKWNAGKKKLIPNNPFMLEVENGFIKALSAEKLNAWEG